ncbi:hypothetical protein OJF2_08760 [Aquisphaera giovannonii]|uniref:Spore protein YkvP/CgeB glycosyl transferase-like domain-containing protein n=1 Tax=Aquisphaera giovannonii TaxID=406548 RepID=A0A5B9VVE5_9BACT|nr:glycosyltransferase [Aquisphaera giovannonii]QEH32406.1 hypothetical protein OJF2_08760 [Aquisphaera giovannonii]
MPRRYLFGPVTPRYADENLHEARGSGRCLAFDPGGETDLAVGPDDRWADICGRLPGGWRPDYVVLFLPYTTIPRGVASAPVPIVGLAADWNLLWHYYRLRLPTCDLSFTDEPGVDRLRAAGISGVVAANLFGCERGLLEREWPAGPRDIDILYVGSLHPAEKRERLPWLARMALGLGRRWRVLIRAGVDGEDYRRLLARARLVLNVSVRGECNLRAFEAAAAGAVLLQERANREIGRYFHDGESCALFDETDLEPVAEALLGDEARRLRIARAAREKVRHHGFASFWEGIEEDVEGRWGDLVAGSRRRPRLPPVQELAMRCWQSLCTSTGGGHAHDPDPRLVADLRAAAEDPGSGVLENALGLSRARSLQRRDPTGWRAEVSLPHFRNAARAGPDHPMARLNLAECLLLVGRSAEAAAQARAALAIAERGPLDVEDLGMGHFPPAYDAFRVEWERAAWLNAGSAAGEVEAKRDLLRWRLHEILAELEDDPSHERAAIQIRRDLGPTHASLGLRLARRGRLAEAAGALREALAINPFDRLAARALGQVLSAMPDGRGLSSLATQRRLLSRAAPEAIPLEPWFESRGDGAQR